MEEIFWICIFFIGIIFLNPLLLGLISLLTRKPQPIFSLRFEPSISSVTIARSPEEIWSRLESDFDYDYPRDKIERIIYFDGVPDLEKIQKRFPEVIFLSSQERKGKNQAMNSAFLRCQNEIIVYSDADVLFFPDTVKNLVRHFQDPTVGGVCGRIDLIQEGDDFIKAQGRYFRFDRRIKLLESRLGSISTNSGALYAIRRSLFEPIPLTVTDDLFICLMIHRKGYRFVYEPDAKVQMRASSRHAKDEIKRRRRIVCRSLTGLWMMRRIFNPLKFSLFSFSLFLNKVLRRFLPLFLLLLGLSNMFLIRVHFTYVLFFLAQLVFYFSAILYPAVSKFRGENKISKKWFSIPYYFVVGNWGTLLGLSDFLKGRRVVRW